MFNIRIIAHRLVCPGKNSLCVRVEVSGKKVQKKNKDAEKLGQKIHNFTACLTIRLVCID